MGKLSEIESKLEDAASAYRSACQRYDSASREKTACLNSLNEVQRAFDKALEEYKAQSSMSGSDWAEARHRRQGVSGL